jgi:hypothetical protein
MSILYSRNEGNLLPELLMVMDLDDILKIVDIYGGKLIRIPEKEDLLKELQVVVYYYLVHCLRVSNSDIQKILKITPNQARGIEDKILSWIAFLKRNNLLLPEGLFKTDKDLIDAVNEELLRGRSE